MTNFEKVGLFMSTFGQDIKKKASLSSDKINAVSYTHLTLPTSDLV